MSVGIISHYLCANHEMGEHHPEAPERLSAIQDQLIRSGLDFAVKQYDATPIQKEKLSLVHQQNYINYIYQNSPSEGYFRIDDDTLMNKHTLTAALHAAGSGLQAVDLIMKGEHSSVFCATRPPGHHAERDEAMGFCFFNNIAVAAAYALNQYDLSRVAIVDFDVHHGNGTEEIFSARPEVLFCSTYQHPFYPFSGHQVIGPNVVNSPLAATASSDEFREAITHDWLPALNSFKPEMIFISAGFDAHAEDEMSNVRLYETDYRWVTEQVREIADRYSEGRIVSMLEGGYDLSSLGRSVVAHINGLIGN